MIKHNKNPAERMQSIHDSLSRAVYSKVQEAKMNYTLGRVNGMEELPDQKRYTSYDEIKSASRDVEVHGADGTNEEDWEEERSPSGKKNTLLNRSDADGEELEESRSGDANAKKQVRVLENKNGTYTVQVRKAGTKDPFVDIAHNKTRKVAEKMRKDIESGKGYQADLFKESKLDPVGRADDDIDNDGDVDDEDKYLKNRRKAIKKSMNEAPVGFLEEKITKKGSNRYAYAGIKDRKNFDVHVDKGRRPYMDGWYISLLHVPAPNETEDEGEFRMYRDDLKDALRLAERLIKHIDFNRARRMVVSGEDAEHIFHESSRGRHIEDFLEEGFSDKQLDALKKGFAGVNKVDPSSPTYKKLIKKLDDMDKDQLTQIADANIKFVSVLAKNRLRNLKESAPLQEAKFKVGDTVMFDRGRVLPKGKGKIKEIKSGKHGNTYVIDGGSKFDTYASENEISLAESELSESVKAIKSIAKSGKDSEITLDDDEEFELDGDVAKALVDKASDSEIKKALKDYESMMKLINKVLR